MIDVESILENNITIIGGKGLSSTNLFGLISFNVQKNMLCINPFDEFYAFGLIHFTNIKNICVHSTKEIIEVLKKEHKNYDIIFIAHIGYFYRMGYNQNETEKREEEKKDYKTLVELIPTLNDTQFIITTGVWENFQTGEKTVYGHKFLSDEYVRIFPSDKDIRSYNKEFHKIIKTHKD